MWAKIFVVVAALMWAASSTVAQYLLTHSAVGAKEITMFRLLCAGIIFILASGPEIRQLRRGHTLTRRDMYWRLPLFGVVGIFFMQYTYMQAIQLGNAAAATVLQYLAPVIIVIFMAAQSKRWPNVTESITTLSATLGVYLLVTGGDWHQLEIPFVAFTWGLLSAFALAFHTVYPRRLLQKIPARLLLGTGMLSGALFGKLCMGDIAWASLFADSTTILCSLAVVFLGTVFPFYLYLYALHSLEPTTVSVIACLEPVAVVLFSILFLQMQFAWGQLIGIAAVIGAIILLSLSKENR